MDSTPKRKREKPVEPPPVVRKKRRSCQGCIEGHLNQQGHYGGCIPDTDNGETSEDCWV